MLAHVLQELQNIIEAFWWWKGSLTMGIIQSVNTPSYAVLCVLDWGWVLTVKTTFSHSQNVQKGLLHVILIVIVNVCTFFSQESKGKHICYRWCLTLQLLKRLMQLPCMESKTNICSPHIPSFFFFCISSSNLPYQTGIKRRGNINLWSGDTREVSGLVAIPCLQLVSKLAISKEASPLQEWDLS